jgi:hypothetical protein
MVQYHLIVAALLLLTQLVSGQKVRQRRQNNNNNNNKQQHVSRLKVVGSTQSSTENLDSNSPIIFRKDASVVEAGRVFGRKLSSLEKKSDQQVSLNIPNIVLLLLLLAVRPVCKITRKAHRPFVHSLS